MSCASGLRGRALEALADPARAKGTIRRIGEELGVHPEALRTWVKKAQIDQGTRPGTTTDEAQRIKELEKELRELRRANAIPKSASACLSRRSVSARPVDLPVHRDQEGGVQGLADLQGAHWRRSQDRPKHLTHARRSRPPSARSLRDETLKAEISKIHKNQLLGAGDPHDARDAGPTRGRRASRCRSRGPVHRRAAHGCLVPARRQTRQVPAHHAQRTTRAVPGRPRQKAFQRVQAEQAVGRRHSPASGRYPLLCTHLLGVGLRRLHHRRVLPEDHRLADHLSASVHRPCPGRPGDGRLAAETSEGLISLAWCITCDRGVQYRSIRHGAALSECEAITSVGSTGDSFWLCPGRGSELLVQGRADP